MKIINQISFVHLFIFFLQRKEEKFDYNEKIRISKINFVERLASLESCSRASQVAEDFPSSYDCIIFQVKVTASQSNSIKNVIKQTLIVEISSFPGLPPTREWRNKLSQNEDQLRIHGNVSKSGVFLCYRKL